VKLFRWLALAGIIAAILAAVVWATSAGSGARADDAAATHAYLSAKDLAVRAGAASAPAAIGALSRLRERLDAECPHILRGAPGVLEAGPHDSSEVEISEAVHAVVLGMPERAEYPILERFARTVKGLRFSNVDLTRLIHSSASERALQAAIQPPNLCAELRAWLASDKRIVPTSTKRFVGRVREISRTTQVGPAPDGQLAESELHEALASGIDGIIARRLVPYENRDDRTISSEIRQLQAAEGRSGLPGLLAAEQEVYRVLEAPRHDRGVHRG
jgi:hypothetical protein